ncbi:hypothetical protein N7452_007470 [Penicillium brevicompactum]|uniref:Uncharacterized protein n=1 Tax=Penicillium brevicompactum TaxID=5074 RepID=A0A9W9UEU3_PENBR|nr:hypothetical protein N7452_007470 [Penicillium brevicompactum]
MSFYNSYNLRLDAFKVLLAALAGRLSKDVAALATSLGVTVSRTVLGDSQDHAVLAQLRTSLEGRGTAVVIADSAAAMEDHEADGTAEIALFTAEVGGRVIDGKAGTEVTGVKVAEELAEEELAVAMPARRREIELNLVSAISLLAAISPALAITPLVEQLQQLTDAATDVRDTLKGASPVNIVQTMPRVIGNWQSSIAAQKQRYIEDFPQSIEEGEIGIICQEFINYATASQEFMNTVTGKAGLVAVTPFTQPVNSVMDVDFGYTKTFTQNIEGVAPDCKEAIAEPAKKFLEAYEQAQKAYSD